MFTRSPKVVGFGTNLKHFRTYFPHPIPKFITRFQIRVIGTCFCTNYL